jgi:hypothetical protein
MLLVDGAIEFECGQDNVRVDASLHVMRPALSRGTWQRRSLGTEAQQQEPRKNEAFHRGTHGRFDKL